MSAPAISVLMSVYNGEAYLAEAIESILAQSFADFEFIIVNDGSTDGSGDIIRRYTDTRIRLLEQPNSGLIVALNRGVAEAQGKYIARMDADDIALPGRLALQYAHLEAHPEIGVLGGSISIMDAEGNRTRDSAYPQGHAEMAAFIVKGSPLAHPAVMMRTDLVKKLGGYRAAYRHAEDYDLWLRVFEHSRIDNLPDIVLRYRQHANNVSFKHAGAQGLASAVARLTHKLRSAGRPDPTNDMTTLEATTISRQLGLTPEEESAFNIEILNVLHSSFVSTENWAELDPLLQRLQDLPVPPAARAAMAAMYIRTAALYVRKRRLFPALRLGLAAFRWDFGGVTRAIYAKVIGRVRMLRVRFGL